MALRYGIVVAAAVLVVACGSSDSQEPTRLVLAGDGEAWVVDVGAERVRRVELPQLAPGDFPHRIVRRGDRLVLFGEDTYVSGPDLARLRPLGQKASFFIPSAHEDRIWLVFLEAGNRRVRAVRELRVDGRVTVPDAEPPGGLWPAGAVTEGLLLTARNGGVLVWDPATGETLRRLPEAVYGPATGNLVVSCRQPCAALQITDVGTGETRTLPAPAGHVLEPWQGGFSPDGEVLALPVQPAPDTTDRTLALVNVVSGRVTLVEGSRVPPPYTHVTWSRSGQQVFFTGGARIGPRVLVGYRLGDERAEIIDVEVGDFYYAAAL
jgi:hypothetical protein